jgi:hypothetical protein
VLIYIFRKTEDGVMGEAIIFECRDRELENGSMADVIGCKICPFTTVILYSAPRNEPEIQPNELER